MPGNIKGMKLVKWDSDEREAWAKRMAQVIAETGAPLNTATAHTVGGQEGHGYRPRHNKADTHWQIYGKIVREFKDRIEKMVADIKAGNPPAMPAASASPDIVASLPLIPQHEPLPMPHGPLQRVFWREEEIEALCAKLVRDKIMLGKPITHRAVADNALLVGFGYRPKKIADVPTREKFLEDNAKRIERLTAFITKKWTAHKQELDAKRREEEERASAPPPAPAPEPAAPEPSPSPSPAPAPVPEPAPEPEPVAQVQPPQIDGSIAEGVAMLLGGARMIVSGLVRETMREEFRSLGLQLRQQPAPQPQGPVEATIDLKPVHDHIRAVEDRVMAMFASMEAAMARRQLAAPPPSIVGGDRQPNLPRSAALPAIPPPEKKKKPLVVILGAETSEVVDIKLDFAYALDLRFYAGDKMPTESKIDFVIAYADHVTETMQKTIKKKVQAPFNAINGGHKLVKLCIQNRTGVKPEHMLNPMTANG